MPSPSPPLTFDSWLKRWFRWLLPIGVLVNLSGLAGTVAEPDSALYATLARHMAESGDFVDLIANGGDWLDKPHFPFWVTALSFRLLGVSAVAYRLPALLFWGLGVVYTYLLARRLHDGTVARVAVLLLLVAQHLLLSNNDVRAEPFLLGLITGSVYHYVRAQESRFSLHLVVGSLLAACAVMTKGLFVLLPVCGGLVVHWLVRRQWRELWRPRWWAALVLVGVFILPELYCLYQQFDLHPEKAVFGRTGVSGLGFFFWGSQFGRFMNTGPIQGKGHPLFFFHTVLWGFLPWSLWLYAAVLSRVFRRRQEPPERREFITWGSAGLTFLVFSLSRFQLPHYLNIVFPFFSIITAQWACRLERPGPMRVASGVQTFVAGALLLLGLGLLWLFRPPLAVPTAIGMVALGVASLFLFRSSHLSDAIGRSFAASVAFNLMLNGVFYPAVARYQSGSEAAAFINGLPPRPVGLFDFNSYALELYTRAPVQRWDLPALQRVASTQPVYVFLPEEAIAGLQSQGLSVQTLRAFEHFPVTRLTWSFLNHNTRTGVLRQLVVAEVRAE
ncbi:MAG: ArnT family glycosyltransferase [Hyalangium sp.]|uniref:ArnT family glycosyltransferase n=1 Tax=Hyalangium sp. TaxID=2028555 RepID=UPI00389A7F98